MRLSLALAATLALLPALLPASSAETYVGGTMFSPVNIGVCSDDAGVGGRCDLPIPWPSGATGPGNITIAATDLVTPNVYFVWSGNTLYQSGCDFWGEARGSVTVLLPRACSIVSVSMGLGATTGEITVSYAP